jgi:hypothetical protein
MRRRVQIAAQLSVFGMLASFAVLWIADRSRTALAAFAHAALVVSFAVYLASVLYLRLRKCPVCRTRFVRSKPSIVGAFRDMTEDSCQSCGTTIKWL